MSNLTNWDKERGPFVVKIRDKYVNMTAVDKLKRKQKTINKKLYQGRITQKELKDFFDSIQNEIVLLKVNAIFRHIPLNKSIFDNLIKRAEREVSKIIKEGFEIWKQEQ